MLQRHGVWCQVTCQLWVCMHHQFHHYHLNYLCPGCVPNPFYEESFRKRSCSSTSGLSANKDLQLWPMPDLQWKRKLSWWTVYKSDTLVSDVPFTSVNPLTHSVPCLSLSVSLLSPCTNCLKSYPPSRNHFISARPCVPRGSWSIIPSVTQWTF